MIEGKNDSRGLAEIKLGSRGRKGRKPLGRGGQVERSGSQYNFPGILLYKSRNEVGSGSLFWRVCGILLGAFGDFKFEEPTPNVFPKNMGVGPPSFAG